MIRVRGLRPLIEWDSTAWHRAQVGIVLLVGLLSAGAPQADPAESEWGYALAHELMSPYCPGRTLAACPSEQAAEVRQWILIQEAAGATREEVIANLEVRFGEQIHSSPAARGWGLAAWGLPAGALALGALLVFWVLRRMVTGQAAPGSAPTAQAPERPVPDEAARDRDAELEKLVDAEFSAGDR